MHLRNLGIFNFGPGSPNLELAMMELKFSQYAYP